MNTESSNCSIVTENDTTYVKLNPSDISLSLNGKLSDEDIKLAEENMTLHNEIMDLKRDLYNECHNCKCCNTNSLFHSIPYGSIKSKVMIINKMPTQYEACRMHCMSDRNGMFLSLILQKMKVDREDVYMTDMIKCNAQLDQSSFNECINHYLRKEINIVSPRMIICNGLSVLKTGIKTGLFVGLPPQVCYGNIYNTDKFGVMAIYDLDTVLQKSGDDYAKCKYELWHQLLNAFQYAYQ